MNDTDRRAASRLRIATERTATNSRKGEVAPGLTGAEVVALKKLTPNSGAQRGNTEFDGGWQFEEFGHNDWFFDDLDDEDWRDE